MTRTLDAAPIGILGFAAALTLASLTIGAGLIPNDTVSLWAGAIMAGDGNLTLGHVVAAYPTLPFLATVALELVMPAGAPTPALLAAGLAGILAGAWYIAFRAAGLRAVVAGAATALLACHPVMLRAAVAGPSEILVAVFLYLFGNALFDLRARGAAPEVMMVALSLAGLSFSHPMGAAIACAVVPYLVFAVRPTLVANSAFNVVLTLVFPAVFAVGAFTYISWVFPGAGWSFYSAPAQSLTTWATSVTALIGGGLSGVAALDAGFFFAFALALSAPLALIVAYEIRKRAPLIAPPLVLAAAAVTAAVISVATGWFGEPAAVAVAAPVLCAVLIKRIPFARQDTGRMLGLLALGWVGGALALTLIDPRGVAQFGGDTAPADIERVATLNIGRVTAGRTGVLVDTDNAPAVVVGRTNSRGLLSPGNEQFTLAMLLGRLEAPFVAVPDPLSATGAGDRIVRRFPSLYSQGAPGYRLIFENKTWRLYGHDWTTRDQSTAAETREAQRP